MIRRARVGVLAGLVLALTVVGTLGWMWWDSRLPGSYSAMGMGQLDLGGGPGTTAHHAPGEHQARSAVSVADLDTETTRQADVVVDLTARQGTVKLASGRSVQGYSVNNSSPGPLITATVGELVEVRLHNESVQGGVALHWHGVDVPNAQDGVSGVTQDSVPPGEDHVYRWVAPDAGTYWYHSHQLSNEQVAGGLFGAIVIRPRTPETGVRDVVALSHLYDGVQTLDGRSGTRKVPAEPGSRVRVRIVNTDNGPQTAWVTAPFVLRAVDGADVRLPTEVSDRSVNIPAGGRVDLQVQTPRDGTAVRVQLLGEVSLLLGPEGSEVAAVDQPARQLDLLAYGSPADTGSGAVGLASARPDRRFEYSVGRRPGFIDGRPGIWWSVNGKLYPDTPMFVVSEGDVVRLRISNHSGEVHPMHLHGHHALVLSRNGTEATGSPWWYDSLDVKDGESFEVAFRADNPGIWMDHCHNLKHAEEGMITHLMYDGVTTPYLLGDETGNVPE